MRFLKILAKGLNPFVWLFNFMNYGGHLEMMRPTCKCTCSNHPKSSEPFIPYDFSKDVKYF